MTRPIGRRPARRAWIPALVGAVLAAVWPMSCTSVDNLVAPSCTFSMSPSSAAYGGAGGAGSFAVTAGDVCTWSAQSTASWLTITTGASGKGNGTVGYQVVANDVTSPRSAAVMIGTTGFSVSEASMVVNCTFSVSPTFSSFPGDGGSGDVSIGGPAGCPWTASPGVNWIAITTPTSGTGSGSISFTVSPNSGSSTRQGSLSVAGQTVGVAEAAPAPNCTFAASPPSASYDATGGTGAIDVAAGGGCAWSASSDSTWVTITSGAVGTGNGTVHYSVAANTGGSRMGTLSVAGTSIPISQAAPCAFTVKPTSASYTMIGGGGTITVTTTAGCAWTATENANWIAISSGAQGTGSGTVTYTIEANTSGKDRTSTMTVAGVDVTITETGTLHHDAVEARATPLAAGSAHPVVSGPGGDPKGAGGLLPTEPTDIVAMLRPVSSETTRHGDG